LRFLDDSYSPVFRVVRSLSLVSLGSKLKSLLPWHVPSINVQLHQRRHNACSQRVKIGTLARQDGTSISLAAVALVWPFLLFASRCDVPLSDGDRLDLKDDPDAWVPVALHQDTTLSIISSYVYDCDDS
jgi:hypothetical protein